MTTSYAEAKSKVERLVDRFADLSARNRKQYNEPATRQGFILPLFHALGWNTENTREVSPEEKVSRGFVDFAFRIGGVPRFFLETKKIPEDLEKPRWAQQAINYAWLKGVTWAVLSDFEDLKVFNAEWQETIPARAIFKDLHWQEYLDRFDDLWLLSYPAMEEGLLDRAAEAVGKKAKRTPVSRQLFADLTDWRRDLFRTLRPYNPMWSVEQIDEAVQRILDRLIFIRTCEDRGIESKRLQPLLREWRDQGRKKDLVRELNALFREFDSVYDSRLFSPHLCEELTSEPTPFERIVEGLYEVPGGYGEYDFNAIDADVLGTIYEQYLGHRAQDPEGKQVVDKRAKRKAQGIYYTPQFVVRYIVAQTLGCYLQEHDYAEARQVRVLDMACGSGSFLIEAFDVLDRYLAGMRGHDPASPAGDMHDLARRMEILTGNLYGVDLDAQAVEIAQLNLLLKAVNQRAILPKLTNVRQGNSLISGTPGELETAFGPGWREKHPFNWEQEFPQVMAQGGFDVIVGNPPYKLMQISNTTQEELDYIQSQYEVAQYKIDSYHIFMERGLRLLREHGYFGYIVPNTFLMNVYTDRLRTVILDSCRILQIVTIPLQVFPEASVDTAIILLQREESEKTRKENRIQVLSVLGFNGANIELSEPREIKQSIFSEAEGKVFNVAIDMQSRDLFEKVRARSVNLGSLCRVYFGIQTHDRTRYVAKTPVDASYKPAIDGGNITRYRLAPHVEYVSSDPDAIKSGGDETVHTAPEKIVVRQIGTEPIATYDDAQHFSLNTIYNIVPKECPYSVKYLLAVINSKLIGHLWRIENSDQKATFPKVKKHPLQRIPVRRIDFSDPADVACHDRMVALVEEMLRVQKEHAQAEAARENHRHDLARQIERLDAQIDALVYELYGLTEDEIRIIEENR
jgi:type I restriction-modification system DNA methylase subunit